MTTTSATAIRRPATLSWPAVLAAALASTGCSGSTADTLPAGVSDAGTPTAAASSDAPSGAAGPPAAVPAGAHLSPQDFATAASAAGTVVLDVRTAAEVAAGHLPGAVNADVESADFTAAMGGLDKQATYAIYCHTGGRSGVALGRMKASGLPDAYDLTGGISAWSAAGGQVLTGQ